MEEDDAKQLSLVLEDLKFHANGLTIFQLGTAIIKKFTV